MSLETHTELPHAGDTATNTKSRRNPQMPLELKTRRVAGDKPAGTHYIPTCESLLIAEVTSQAPPVRQKEEQV